MGIISRISNTFGNLYKLFAKALIPNHRNPVSELANQLVTRSGRDIGEKLAFT